MQWKINEISILKYKLFCMNIKYLTKGYFVFEQRPSKNNIIR